MHAIKIRSFKMPPLTKIAAALLCSLLMILIVVKPEIYLKSAKDGLLLFAASVLPALFPFFFLSTFLTKLGVPKYIAKLGKKPFKFLFNAPPVSAYIFLMSILSGYPTGAKLISELTQNNAMSQKEAEKCSSFCTTTNPVFILGTVGSVMLKNFKLSLLILVAHYLGAVINGLIFRGKKEANITQFSMEHFGNSEEILSSSIVSATGSMLVVGGFVCIFNVFLDAMCDLKVIPFLANILSFALPKDLTVAVFSGFIEMTRGCYFVSNMVGSEALVGALCCLIVSFGGLSIFCQSVTYLSKCKIKPLNFFFKKITHSLLGFILCYLLCLIFL